MFDLIIIGGGPGGTAAGVYASRKHLKTLLIAKEWGGQSVVSPDIENWIGTPHISGADLAKSLEGHLKTYAGETVTIESGKKVVSITKNGMLFTVTLEDGTAYEARAVLITTGSKRKPLLVPGAAEFEMKGLTYCASCDGPLFADQDVVVIGGGNAGFESAAQLLAYAKSVTLLHHRDSFKADPVTVNKVLAHPNMKGVLNAEPLEVIGDAFVKGLKYRDAKTGEEVTLPVAGIFVEIGVLPNTEFVGNTVTLDEYGRIEIDPWTGQTSTLGIWAAGDCTNIRYHQNNISAGDAVRALEDIYVNLKAK